MAWEVTGSYYEACNCEAVCPCRAEGDRKGGRSTYGYCDFVLSWWIHEGHIDGRDLAGRKVVLVGSYSDDEERSPWRVSVFVDSGADEQQVSDLAAIFTGQLGGDTHRMYALVIREVKGVYTADIDLVHEPRKWKIGVDHRVLVRSTLPAEALGPVSCAIPGHEHPGTELVADRVFVDKVDGFDFDLNTGTSFETDFAYQG